MFKGGVLYLGDVSWLLCKVLVFHVFRNQPLSPEDVKGKALRGGPRCWCRILFASAIFFKKDNETGTDIQKQFSLEGFSALQAQTLQTVRQCQCELQPVKELLIETAPDQKPCPAKFIPDLWTANSKEAKNTPNCVRATPIYVGVRGSWSDSVQLGCGHAT